MASVSSTLTISREDTVESDSAVHAIGIFLLSVNAHRVIKLNASIVRKNVHCVIAATVKSHLVLAAAVLVVPSGNVSKLEYSAIRAQTLFVRMGSALYADA